MINSIKPLDKKEHADLKINRKADFSFAKSMISVPLVWKEVSYACKEYPVVFPVINEKEIEAGQGPLPMAMLSLINDKNLFTDDNGGWQADYIPAIIRRYPFGLAEMSAAEKEDEKQFVILIDDKAPHFSGDNGEPLFEEDGKPAPSLLKAQAFLENLHRDTAITRDLTLELEKQQLLVAKNLTIGKEKQRTVTGFRVLDEQKMKKLDDTILGQWAKKPLMSLLIGHLISMGNIQKLAKLHGTDLIGK